MKLIEYTYNAVMLIKLIIGEIQWELLIIVVLKCQ
jgi:hypothetical protein